MPASKTIPIMRDSLKQLMARQDTPGITAAERTELIRSIAEVNKALAQIYRKARPSGRAVAKKRREKQTETGLTELMK